jgi:hypothetical protein
MGMGGGVIQQAFAQAMNPGGYVNPSMFNAYSAQQPSPYQPAGSGYSTAPSGGGEMAGRYEIRKMAKGGIAAAAEQMANKGRNGDSVLVHMTPGEVDSLQTLAKAHGGSLTINPATGLAEAGFLKNILPMVAGAALSPFITPMGAAAVVGGFEGIRTGDVGKGLLAGMGAFGGANLAGSLASTGTSAGLGAATTEATAAGNLAGNQALQGTGYEAMKNAGLTDEFIKQSATDYASNAAGTAASPFSEGTRQMLANPTMTGAKTIYNTPGGMTDFLGSNKMNLAMSAAPAVSDAMTPKPIDEITPEKSSGRYLASDFEGYEPRRPNPYYRPMGLGYAAQGGMMPNDLSYADGGMIDPMQQMPNGGLAALQGMRDGYSAPQTMAGNIPQMADGGSIGGYSDGGRMLKGPGDGMSDSIPAMIGKRQPARLADGEFVVPADVVSHLGNGSTDAGAKHLYKMMDKVRKARTGTKKQGKQIKPQKFMPA